LLSAESLNLYRILVAYSIQFLKRESSKKSFTQAARKKAVAAACIIGFGLLNPAHATFPGENGVIVFTANGAVQKTGATGFTPTVLAENAYAPAVSPNGRWLAYVDLGSRNILIRNVDGTVRF
jgi:hypothetical protein